MDRFENLAGRAAFFLFFFWLLWFLSFTTRAIFAPVLPLIEDEFGISHATAGSLFAFISLGYSLSLFLAGILGGRAGHKKSILFSLFSSALLYGAILFVHSFLLLRLLAFVMGFSAGVYLPSVLPLITTYYHERVWGRTIAIHDSAASFSVFAAPLICLLLLKFSPWRGIFAVMGCLSFLCGVLLCFIGYEVRSEHKTQADFAAVMKRKTLWIIGVMWIFAAGSNMGVYFVFPLYLTKEIHMDIDSANTIFGVSRLGGIVIAVLAGFIIDRFNLKKTMFLCLLLTGLVTISLTCRDAGWMKGLLFLQASIAVGFFPMGLVMISRTFEQEVRGQATGLIVTLGVIVGVGLIPYLLGLCGDHLSFRFGIFLLGLLTLLSSGLMYFLKEAEAG